MDWFERLTGFREASYDDTRAKLKVDASRLESLINGRNYGIGHLELVSLDELRDRARSAGGIVGRLRVTTESGDVRPMHQLHAGALFQVASQFNLLEMSGPTITPEHGVTRYQFDRTQGPACAIAAGAATIYRNYFAEVNGGHGQTAKRQLDGLADLGKALSHSVNKPVKALWKMQNGYALCTRPGLDLVGKHLSSLNQERLDALRGTLRIGIQNDVEVTDGETAPGPFVSQVFCSALPVAYTNIPSAHWEPFAILVLEAAYEATMWAAVLNAKRDKSTTVLLTLIGGGAFGNKEQWIYGAIRRALKIVSHFQLDVRLVSYHSPSTELLQVAEEFR